MFALHPHGKPGPEAGAPQNAPLWYFTQLGLYFGAIRLAYTFWAGREEGGKALE